MSVKGKSTTTSPILDINIIRRMEQEIPGRDGLYFMFGLYTALRAGEIIRLKYSDVIALDYQVKHEMTVKMSKQSALKGRLVTRTIKLMKPLRQRIKEFHKSEGRPPLGEWIFKAKRNSTGAHLGYHGANGLVKKWLRRFNVDCGNKSTHVLRKTMARQYYERVKKAGGDALTMTMTLLSHSDPGTTLTYIGITQEEMSSYMTDEFYVDYTPLRKKIESGIIDITTIFRKIKGAFPVGPQSVWVSQMKQELSDYDDQDVQEVVDLYLPVLRNM